MRKTEMIWERWRHLVMRAGMVGVSLLVLCGLLLTDMAQVVEAADRRDGTERTHATDGEKVEARGAVPRAARRDVGTEIVGGTLVPPGKYSFSTYIQAILQIGERTFVQSCTGSLIDSLHVVTAAHCVEYNAGTDKDPDIRKVLPSQFTLVIGRASLFDVPGANIFFVADSTQHPLWNREDLDHDIAVLLLTDPVPASVAKPVTMVARNDRRFDSPGQRAIAAGWGLTAGFMDTYDLMQMTTTVISDAACDRFFGGDVDDESIFCARVPAKSTCSGDSGGPLFALQNARQVRQGHGGEQAGEVSSEGKNRKKRKKKRNKRKKRKERRKKRRERRRNAARRPLLIGVTSFGLAGCALGSPNGFTQLSSPVIHDFVMDVVND